mgnify:CR=1 FL=1
MRNLKNNFEFMDNDKKVAHILLFVENPDGNIDDESNWKGLYEGNLTYTYDGSTSLTVFFVDDEKQVNYQFKMNDQTEMGVDSESMYILLKNMEHNCELYPFNQQFLFAFTDRDDFDALKDRIDKLKQLSVDINEPGSDIMINYEDYRAPETINYDFDNLSSDMLAKIKCYAFRCYESPSYVDKFCTFLTDRKSVV